MGKNQRGKTINLAELTAFFNESVLAGSILVLYFVVEPKLGHSKGFLSNRNFFNMLCAVPFAEFLVGFLIQGQHGKSDWLIHSITYDIFYLRTNDAPNGAHIIDYMFLPLIFFYTVLFIKKGDSLFAGLCAGAMVFFHEGFWFFFYYAKYGYAFNVQEALGDVSFIILISAIGFVALKKYRYFFVSKIFGIGFLIYVIYLAFWYAEGFHVTVINNTTIGKTQFLTTQWYGDFYTNVLEVVSWIIIFGVFLVAEYFQRKKTEPSKITAQ